MGSTHVITGDDPVLVASGLRTVVDALVGGGDRALLVEELGETQLRNDDGPRIASLVDAAATPPFLTEHRIIVGRNLAAFSTKEAVAPLVAYLTAPLATTDLVLVWERPSEATGRLVALPKSLKEALETAGALFHETAVGRGDTRSWLVAQVGAAGLSLTPAATQLLLAHLGQDHGRLPGILETLVGARGTGGRLDVDDIGPYLGEAGDVAPWELTDAIAAGDVVGALDALHRGFSAGERHPLQVLASLHAHYARLLRLDGSGARGEKEAAALLGMKGSTFPAKKALVQTRELGSAGVTRAIGLLAQADLDIRGATGTPETIVCEVLVARLARLGGRADQVTRSS